MKKISYRNVLPRENQKITSDKLPSVGSSDSATESGGRNGYLFTGLPDTHELPDEPMTTEHVGLIDDFLSIADNLDDQDLETEANFIDFLIEKFAAVSAVPSEEEKYIEYIYKINNSDIPNVLQKIQNLTINYSKKIKDLVSSGIEKEDAKKQSFSAILMREDINA